MTSLNCCKMSVNTLLQHNKATACVFHLKPGIIINANLVKISSKMCSTKAWNHDIDRPLWSVKSQDQLSRYRRNVSSHTGSNYWDFKTFWYIGHIGHITPKIPDLWSSLLCDIRKFIGFQSMEVTWKFHFISWCPK